MDNLEKKVKREFPNNKEGFIANLAFTKAWINNLYSEFFSSYSISPAQYNILRILRTQGDWVTMNDVKELMIEKSPNTTRLADKLLKKELIKRQRSETDRRIVYIQITPKGLELVAEIDEKRVVYQTELMQKFTLEEAQQMNSILNKIRG